MPTAIQIAGPGPQEPSKEPLEPVAKHAPITANESDTDLIDASSSGDHDHDHADGDGENEDDYIAPRRASGDPYANLDNAFAGYAADEPKPRTDDLLF